MAGHYIKRFAMWQRHSCFLKEKQHKKHQHTSELHKSSLLTITKQLQRSTWIFVYLRVLLAPAHTHTRDAHSPTLALRICYCLLLSSLRCVSLFGQKFSVKLHTKTLS